MPCPYNRPKADSIPAGVKKGRGTLADAPAGIA